MTRRPERHSAVEVVCKIGGSLSRPEVLRPLLGTLQSAHAGHRILVVPGGGPFADAVRTESAAFQLGETASHWMAIMAMDQYGTLIADLAKGTRTVRTPVEITAAFGDGALPILLPFALLRETDPLPHSWDVTSDTIAAYAAALLGADLLILLKDVDGVLTADPRTHPRATLIPRLGPSRLANYACVDAGFATEARRVPRCWILNGRHPERLITLLRSGETVGTEIVMDGAAE